MSSKKVQTRESARRDADARRRRVRSTQPAVYLKMMLDVVAEHGIDPREALRGSKLTMAQLETPNFRVASPEALGVMLCAMQLTGNKAMGYEFGLRSLPTSHGSLGYAAMSCRNLREGLDLVARYLYIRQRDIALKVEVGAEYCSLTTSDLHQLGPLRHIVHESMLIGLYRMIGMLVAEKSPQCELWFDWAEPDYHQRYKQRLPVVYFSRPSIQLRIPNRYLSQPLFMADPNAVRMAIEQCEREMAAFSPGNANILERVRAELTPGSDGYPDLQTIAACLFMSTRTLKRKLDHLGTSFKELLDEVRFRDARYLLDNSELAIQQIAAALGYSDPPSFTRAFRRWSGQSPSESRRTVSS